MWEQAAVLVRRKYRTRRHAYRRMTNTIARLALQSVPSAMIVDSLTFLPTQLSPAGVFTGAAGLQLLMLDLGGADVLGPRDDYAVNDVPHPHDFCAFGFLKTNPCCISVSS